MVLDLGRQPQVGPVGLRHHQQPRGVPVNPVDDAGALHPVDAGEGVPTVVEEGVDERPGRVPRGRVDDHSFGLVDDQKVFVLIDDVQRDVFRLQLQRFRLRQGEGNLHPGCYPQVFVLFAGRAAVHLHLPAFDQLLGKAAGQIGALFGNPAVQTLARVRRFRPQQGLFRRHFSPPLPLCGLWLPSLPESSPGRGSPAAPPSRR